jgi:hypothetical protein
MARPQVADRGDGLQIWRVAANIMNNLLLTADEGWSYSLGIRRGAESLHRKKKISFLRNVTKIPVSDSVIK